MSFRGRPQGGRKTPAHLFPGALPLLLGEREPGSDQLLDQVGMAADQLPELLAGGRVAAGGPGLCGLHLISHGQKVFELMGRHLMEPVGQPEAQVGPAKGCQARRQLLVAAPPGFSDDSVAGGHEIFRTLAVERTRSRLESLFGTGLLVAGHRSNRW